MWSTYDYYNYMLKRRNRMRAHSTSYIDGGNDFARKAFGYEHTIRPNNHHDLLKRTQALPL